MKRGEREATIDGVIKPLKKRLKEEEIKAKLFGRAKHFYSIYNKIIRRGKSFSEIYSGIPKMNERCYDFDERFS